MPLNLSDGDFLPFLQYDAKAGRWFAKAEGAAERVEIEKPTLVFDMPNIKTGWIRFQDGPPEHVWDGSPTDPGQKASRPMGEGWKRGFEVLTYSNAGIPGTQSKLAMRSFSSSAAGVNSVIAGMFCEYENGILENSGKLPVFACKGARGTTINIVTDHGKQQVTIYDPVFELIAWVDSVKVPAFAEYHNSRVQILPPPQQMRRIAATAPNGGATPLPAQQRPSHQFTKHQSGGATIIGTQSALAGQPDRDELPGDEEIPF